MLGTLLARGEEAGAGIEHKIEKSRTIRKIGIEFNLIS